VSELCKVSSFKTGKWKRDVSLATSLRTKASAQQIQGKRGISNPASKSLDRRRCIRNAKCLKGPILRNPPVEKTGCKRHLTRSKRKGTRPSVQQEGGRQTHGSTQRLISPGRFNYSKSNCEGKNFIPDSETKRPGISNTERSNTCKGCFSLLGDRRKGEGLCRVRN